MTDNNSATHQIAVFTDKVLDPLQETNAAQEDQDFMRLIGESIGSLENLMDYMIKHSYINPH